MQILSEAQHRALAYVSAANRGGYRPTAEDLHEWLATPDRRMLEVTPGQGVWAKLAKALKVTAELTDNPFIHEVKRETFADHLVRLRWLEVDERSSLELTPLGRALLRTAETDEDNSDVPTAVVLGAQNELAYPMLIRRLVEARRGLLIDPYLRLEQLLHVRTHTSIKHVLISANVKKEDQTAMAVLIESGMGADGPIEVRLADKGVLHDRFIVGETFIDTIGTSLNTVGRQHPTVLSPLPSPAADTMREQAEKWWTDATPLAVWPPPEVADEHIADEG